MSKPVEITLFDHSGKNLFSYDLDHPIEEYESLIAAVMTDLAKIRRGEKEPPDIDDQADAIRQNLIGVAELMGLVGRIMAIGVDVIEDMDLVQRCNAAILSSVMSDPVVYLHFSVYARAGYHIQMKLPEKPDRLPEIQWVNQENNVVRPISGGEGNRRRH